MLLYLPKFGLTAEGHWSRDVGEPRTPDHNRVAIESERIASTRRQYHIPSKGVALSGMALCSFSSKTPLNPYSKLNPHTPLWTQGSAMVSA